MGMTASYVKVSASQLDDAVTGGMKSADAIWKRRTDCDCWFSGSSSEEEEIAEAQRLGFHLWIDLDKNFRSVYWLLTGKPFPELSVIQIRGASPPPLPGNDDLLSLAMCAENTLAGTEDFGYGPIRYLTPPGVQRVATALANTSWSELAQKHDLQVEEGDSNYWGFVKIMNLYRRAATRSDAILQCFL